MWPKHPIEGQTHTEFGKLHVFANGEWVEVKTLLKQQEDAISSIIDSIVDGDDWIFIEPKLDELLKLIGSEKTTEQILEELL